MRSFDKTFYLIFFFFILMVVFSILLYKNMTRMAKEGENPVIGKLTFKRKTIERKFDFEVIWDRLESGVEIRNRDTIRTGDYSDAVLTLIDETKININENSMIFLDFSDSNTINFAYGSLSLVNGGGQNSANESLKINAGDKVLEVGNSDISLEKTDKDDIKLEVKKGQAKVMSNGEERVINNNQIATLSDKEIDVKEVKLFLKSPEDNTIISGKSNTIPINFEFETGDTKGKIRLELSNDSKFSRLSNVYDIQNKKNIQVGLEAGRYYWRLSAQSTPKKQKEYSGFRKLNVQSTIPPKLITPENNQIFTYSNLPPLVEFNWKKNDSFSDYILEISQSANFTEIIKKQSSTGQNITIDKLPDGKYFARLIAVPIHQDVGNMFSESIRFDIENKNTPDPPILIQPSESQSIAFYSIKNQLFDFTWKDSPEFSNYSIQISNSRDFNQILFSEDLKNNFLKPKLNLQPGNYYWRVKGNLSSEKKSEFSKPSKFIIADIEKIELLKPQNNTTLYNDLSVDFQWKKIESYPNFILEISKENNFQKLYISKNTNSYYEPIDFNNEGIYFWRVKLLSNDGSEITSSNISTFQLDSFKDPKPISPNEGEVIDMSKRNEISFKWSDDKKSLSSIFKLNQIINGSEKTIIKSIKTNKNFYKFEDLSKFDEGNFVWYIQSSYESNGIKKTTKDIKTNFKIILSEKPEIPKIKIGKKIYVE
jgi:hypothetical protein